MHLILKKIQKVQKTSKPIVKHVEKVLIYSSFKALQSIKTEKRFEIIEMNNSTKEKIEVVLYIEAGKQLQY